MVEVEEAAKRIRAENEREAMILAERREKAAATGRRLARAMVEEHPEVTRVWGFGSVFESWRSYRMTSDIDLAVEDGDIIDLMRIVEHEEFPVDIVDLSACPAGMAEFIRLQGLVLAEATK